jgi:hypothetical protein
MSKPADPVHGRIFQIRDHRVILDADLAKPYTADTPLPMLHSNGILSPVLVFEGAV